MAWFQLMPTMCEMQPFSALPFSDRNCLENVMFCLNYQQSVAKCFETKKPPEWVTEHNKKSISLERGVFIGHRHTWREGYNEWEKNSRRSGCGQQKERDEILQRRFGHDKAKSSSSHRRLLQKGGSGSILHSERMMHCGNCTEMWNPS